MESGEWRVESGEWRVESGEWRVERGRGERRCDGFVTIISILGTSALKIDATKLPNGYMINQPILNITQWKGCKLHLSAIIKADTVSQPGK